MKKMMIVLVLVLMAVQCVASAALAEGVQSPITAYDTLEQVNKAVGCKMQHPAVMGVEDRLYLTIDCGDYLIGEYDFTVNGKVYMLRAAKVKDVDISGVYVDDAFHGDRTLFANETLPEKGLQFAQYADSFSSVLAARWQRPSSHSNMPVIDVQYVLVAFNPDEDYMETFQGIAEEMATIVSIDWTAAMNNVAYHQLVGEYEDSFSQRAVATVKLNENDGVSILVHWSSSAWEYTEWQMNCVMDEQNRLVYHDCVCRNVSLDEQLGETAETVYENGNGWFDCDASASTTAVSLRWRGAADESCRDCVFEKLPE